MEAQKVQCWVWCLGVVLAYICARLAYPLISPE